MLLLAKQRLQYCDYQMHNSKSNELPRPVHRSPSNKMDHCTVYQPSASGQLDEFYRSEGKPLTKQNMSKGQSSPRPKRKVIWFAEKWPSLQFLIHRLQRSTCCFIGTWMAAVSHKNLKNEKTLCGVIQQAAWCKHATSTFAKKWANGCWWLTRVQCSRNFKK